MRLPNDESKFTSQFKFVEFGVFIPEAFGGRGGVIRDNKKGEDAKLYTWDEVYTKAKEHDNRGIYTSVWAYSDRHNPGNKLASLYFDLDQDSDFDLARRDTLKLVEYLGDIVPEQAIRIYFTGKKGFHVECEAVALGITPGDNLSGVFRYIAEQIKRELSIESLDFSVYDERRMWRVPNTQHQATGLYKIPLNKPQLMADAGKIQLWAKHQRIVNVPEQAFCYEANEWYRNFIYDMEVAEQHKSTDYLGRFLEHGTHGNNFDDSSLEFDPVTLFDNCDAIMTLWNKAEETGDLDHEERLFLCSILTYDNEAIDYLHAILSCCTDYTYERSNAHIQDWIARRRAGIGGRPFSCERASQAGIHCGGCELLEPRPRYQQIAGRSYETGELAQPSPFRLGYRRKKSVTTNT